jgi:hypothetical protein
MTIQKLTDDEVSGIGIGPEHGVAKSRLNSLIDAVNANVVATDSLEDVVNENGDVSATCTPLPVQTDESEVSDALNGVSTKSFSPREVILKVVSASGSVAADGTVNVGTSADGDDILSAQALTGLDSAGKTRRVPLSEATYNIAANATLYANVESADSTATTLVLSAIIVGKQF